MKKIKKKSKKNHKKSIFSQKNEKKSIFNKKVHFLSKKILLKITKITKNH